MPALPFRMFRCAAGGWLAVGLGLWVLTSCDPKSSEGKVDASGADANAGDSTAAGDALFPPCQTSEDCPAANSPCRVNVCVDAVGCVEVVLPLDALCDDGDLCTWGDRCAAESCKAGEPRNCDDLQPCTTDACDPKTGKCKHTPNDDLGCDDGNPCTQTDVCKGGSCVGGVDICDCVTPSDCTAKDDEDVCNGVLYCDTSTMPHKCKINPATVVTCKQPANVCATRACDPKTGACVEKAGPDGTPCDDGDGCTEGDICKSGKCSPGTQVCCKSTSDCAGAENGNACDGSLFCNKATGKCVLNPITVVTCQTVNDTDCVKNTCDPKTGQCAMAPLADGAACNDDNKCTPNEVCAKGECKAKDNTCKCSKTADCDAQDDGDLCNGTLYCNMSEGVCELNPATVVSCPTVDDKECRKNVCDPKTGKCALTAMADGTVCADGNLCTVDDSCLAGDCASGTNVCACESTADCANYEDGNLCNGTLYCSKKGPKPVCLVNPASLVTCPTVDDGPCQKSMCQGKSGSCAMAVFADYVPCDADGTACTQGDHCMSGKCQPGPNTCGCKEDADCAPFNPMNLCDAPMVCDKAASPSVCMPKPSGAVKCDASKDTQCLKMTCEASSGACKPQPVHEGDPCSDGEACISNTVCNAGACVGQASDCEDGNPCTVDACDKTKGACVHTAVACDDGNVCTHDFCDGASGKCLAVAKDGVCGDGDLCAPPDVCKNGACSKVAKVDCDDANACTTDACDPQTGKCSHAATTAACDDGDACTSSDVCAGGKCLSGKMKDCADSDPCTDDVCNPGTGACSNGPVAPGTSCGGLAQCVPELGKDPALLARFSFDACSTADESPHKHVVKVDGTPDCVDGQVDKGLDFNAKAYVEVKGSPAMEAELKTLSFGGWFRFEGPGAYDAIMGMEQRWMFGHMKGKVASALATGTLGNWAWKGMVAVPELQWVHIAVVYDGKVVETYVNGMIKDVYIHSGNIPAHTCSFNIGARGAGCGGPAYRFPGSADEVFVFSRALTGVEVAAMAKVKLQGGCVAPFTCSLAADCEDANSCTVDSCSETTGKCLNVKKLIGAPCDDSDACTGPDKCAEQSCTSGPPVNCDDKNPCTTDTCAAATGCVHKPATDGTACGGANKCKSGVCEP